MRSVPYRVRNVSYRTRTVSYKNRIVSYKNRIVSYRNRIVSYKPYKNRVSKTCEKRIVSYKPCAEYRREVNEINILKMASGLGGRRLLLGIRNIIINSHISGLSTVKICDLLKRNHNFKTTRQSSRRFIIRFETNGSVLDHRLVDFPRAC